MVFLYLNFSHVKTNRNVLSSQIKQFTVLIRQASFHAINCIKSNRKVYQIGGCFDNFVTWTYSGKKAINSRISLSVYVATGNYIDIHQNAINAENIYRIFGFLII